MDNEIKEFFDSLKIGEIIHFGNMRSENVYVIIIPHYTFLVCLYNLNLFLKYH